MAFGERNSKSLIRRPFASPHDGTEVGGPKACWAEPCRRPYSRWKRMEGWRMLSKGMLARIVVPVLVATTMQPLLAEESVGTTPPATNREWWKSMPIGTVSAGEPAGPQPPAKSIRE